MLCVTRPDVIADLHRSFFDVGCHVVETDSFGSLPWVLAEYGISRPGQGAGPGGAAIARDVADGYGAGTAGWPARSARAPRSPRWARSPSPTMRDGYQEAAAGLIAGGVDLFIIETVQDLLQAKAAIIGCRRAMAEAGRRGAAPGPGHHRDDRAHADGQRDRRRPDHPGRPAPRRHRAQLRHRPGRDGRAPALPERPQPGPHLVPAQRRPALGGRRQDALRPHPGAARRAPPPLRHRVRRQRGRRVLRHHPGAPEGGGGGAGRVDARPPPTPNGSPAAPRSTATCPTTRRHRSSSWASAPTPTAPRSSGTPCWPRTGTPAWPWPGRRSGPAATSSTSASTTPAKTAWPT